jgi:chromate transport protein ChrA
VVLLGVFFAAARRGRLAAVAGMTLALTASAWLVVLVAIAEGVGDVDGFVDCRDSCDAVHYVGALVFLGGALFSMLAAAAFVVGLLLARRRGRFRRRWPTSSSFPILARA